MSTLKISMACWMVANEAATRMKIALARAHGVPTVTGGGPFEIAVAQGELPAYLDLCADVGVTRIECGQGFTESAISIHERLSPPHRAAASMFRWSLGRNTTEGSTSGRSLRGSTRDRNGSMRARVQLVVEARESAQGSRTVRSGWTLEHRIRRPVCSRVRIRHRRVRSPDQAKPVCPAEPFWEGRPSLQCPFGGTASR